MYLVHCTGTYNSTSKNVDIQLYHYIVFQNKKYDILLVKKYVKEICQVVFYNTVIAKKTILILLKYNIIVQENNYWDICKAQ